MEQTIIEDWMEVDIGIHRTTDMVNQHHRDMGKIEIGRSAIMGAFRRLRPYITKNQKKSR